MFEIFEVISSPVPSSIQMRRRRTFTKTNGGLAALLQSRKRYIECVVRITTFK